MRTGRPNLTASESDLTTPSAPPLAMVTEELAGAAVELAMKVAEVLLQAIKERQPRIRVPEDAGSWSIGPTVAARRQDLRLGHRKRSSELHRMTAERPRRGSL